MTPRWNLAATPWRDTRFCYLFGVTIVRSSTRQVAVGGALFSARCVLSFLALQFLGGCRSGACSLLTCESGVAIELSPPVQGEGRYEIVIETDTGAERRCSFTVHDNVSGPAYKNCPGEPLLRIGGLNGGPQRIHFTDTPVEVSLSVPRQEEPSSEGKVLRHVKLRPAYETYRPNGQGCEPACRITEVTLGGPR